VSHAVVLSHDWIAHELGHLEPWFARHGFTVERLNRERPESLPDADLLVVMGSPGSAADAYCTPPTAREIAAVGGWVALGRPYLGLCFGAQVLAAATGGSVRRMPTPFSGYVEMDLAAGAPDALAGPWLTWHEDGLTAPASSELLGWRAHADLAFRVNRAWGLQPHVEVTPETAERMLVQLDVPESQYALIVGVMRDHAERDAERAAALLDAFLEDVSATRE
jgi:GMP synthase-like glutamine amidotransferase